MAKKLLSAFLCVCGVAVLSVSVFTSCKSDSDDLDTKVRVLQDQIAQIEETLKSALLTGVSITGVSKNPAGNTVLTFNKEINGSSTLEIAAGGSDVSVEIKDGVAVITIGGQNYSIPLGAAINSLQYWPEFTDGIVELGNAGANAFFLASPIPENLGLATFNVLVGEIPDRTRASVAAEMIVVSGTVTVENGLVKVPLKGIQVEASKTYRAALEMTIGGTTITSDLFRVNVSSDFSFVSEAIAPAIKPIAEMAATGPAEDGSYTFTMDGAKLLDPLNFNSLFEGIPAGATFRAASAAKQPAGDAQTKQSILAGSLKADGAFAWSARPGTAFGDTGFLIEIVKDYMTIGKAYVKVTDPLADVDFRTPFNNIFSKHLEYGELFAPGANRLDMSATIANSNFATMHDNGAVFCENFANYLLQANNETLLLIEDGHFIATEYLEKLTGSGSRGINWFNVQTSVLGNENPEIADGMDGVPVEYMRDKLGVVITGDGFIETNDTYKGWGLRVGMGLEYEYIYGMKPMTNGPLAFIFLNRRTYNPDLPEIPAR